MTRNYFSKRLQLGLRERNKLNKLRRIKLAARALFTKKGFEATTTLQIARRAAVGEGTLFLYAQNKRDLLFLVFGDELRRISDKAFGKPKPGMPLLDQLVAVFSVYYSEFYKNVPLSRTLLKELIFHRGRLQRPLEEHVRGNLLRTENILSVARSAGLIQFDEDSEFVARYIFHIYTAQVRWWIAKDKPSLTAGIADLRRALTLGLRSVNATPAALGESARPNLRTIRMSSRP